MAAVQGRGASDWQDSTQQEDEGRDHSCRHWSFAGPQGEDTCCCCCCYCSYPTSCSFSFFSFCLLLTFALPPNFFSPSPCSCSLQVVGGKMTEAGRLCAFITKVKRGSLADTVGHLRPGELCHNLHLLLPPPACKPSNGLTGFQETRSWSGMAGFFREPPSTRSTTSSWSPKQSRRLSFWCPDSSGGTAECQLKVS